MKLRKPIISKQKEDGQTNAKMLSIRMYKQTEKLVINEGMVVVAFFIIIFF